VSPDSGLPSAYYEQYSRTYYLNNKQNGTPPPPSNVGRHQPRGGQQQQRYPDNTRAMRPQHAGAGYTSGGSSVASNSDHLSAAVDNLFKMVEKKVVDSSPAPRQPPPTPPQQLPTGAPGDRTSWDIHRHPFRSLPSLPHGAAGPLPGQPRPSTDGFGSERGRRRSWQVRGAASGVGGSQRGRSMGRDLNTVEESGRRSKSKAPSVADEKTAMLLFFLGFLLFPCWFVGALSAVPSKWRTGCRITSVLFLALGVGVGNFLYLLFQK
ncbi:hypothetical protein BC829DRAFT_392968, partial [Chytridium lagenaria]